MQDFTVMRNLHGKWVQHIVQEDGVLVYFGLLILFIKFQDLPGFMARPSTTTGQKLLVQAVQGGSNLKALEPTVEPINFCCNCSHPKGTDWELNGAKCPKCGALYLTPMAAPEVDG